MVLCLLSRGSRGHWTKLNHEVTVRGPEIAILQNPGEQNKRIPNSPSSHIVEARAHKS